MASFQELVKMEYHSADSIYSYSRYYTYEGLGAGWGYLIICAVIGLGLLGGALLLYRRRRLESAGDFIAVKPLAPIFSVVSTLCVGAVFALFSELFSNDFMEVFLIAGLVVGFFGTQMLLARSAKVFQLKSFGRLGIIVGALILSLLLVQWDAFGIVRWTPKVDRVEWVTLSYDRLELTEPEDIQLVINLHKEAIAQGEKYDPTAGSYHYIRITYEMKNGTQVERSYEFPSTSKAYQALKSLYGRASHVLGDVSDMEHYIRSIAMIEIRGSKMVPDHEMLRGLMAAIKADCEAGNMAQHDSYHENPRQLYSIELEQLEADSMYFYRDIKVYSDAENTVAWMNENLLEWVNMSGKSDTWDDEWNDKYGY
jgi:hypothetical protein